MIPLYVVAAASVLLVCFQKLISPRIGFVGYTGSAFYLQDFAYHIILTDHFWFKEAGNFYDLNFQLQALSSYMGRPALAAMPVGVTPLAFIVWMPFAYIADYSLSFAYSLWMTVSIVVLVSALWKIWASLSPVRSFQILPLVLIGISLFSLVAVSTVVVGQTSIFTAGILCLIFYRIMYCHNSADDRQVDWLVIFLVLLGGMKPPYLIIGFGSLLVYGRWGDVARAAGILLLVLVVMTPMMTAGWPEAYLHMLQMYGGKNFPDIYAWAVVPRTMNIFRSAISGLTGDRIAVVGSSIISILVFSGIFIFSLAKARFAPKLRTKLVAGLIACCLLFAPYMGAYEDMLMIPIFVIVLLTGEAKPFSSCQSIVICVALFLCLLHGLPVLPHTGVSFLLKVAVLASMVRYAGNQKQRNPDCDRL